jgi:His/Glu/Gln/Arg/opine family amino acid ABC transporter permease subunit
MFSADLTFLSQLVPALLQGAIVTVQLAAIAFSASLVFGLFIALAQRASKPFEVVCSAYVEIVRNTPVLVQLYLVYYGLPLAGLILDAFWCGALVLIVQGSAYVAEIYRGGLQSISVRQFEAGRALGFSPINLYRRIILPQMLARVVAPLTNQASSTIKDTAQAATIAVTEMTKVGQIWMERSGNSYDVFLMLAILYLVLTTGAGLIGRMVERRVAFAT